ncbi:hypothetical protein WDU94_009583, partial [Cyamophila willieti]
RSSKGRKLVGIPTYDDDSNDLSDLGLSTSSSSNHNESETNNSENTEDIPPDKTTLETEPATKTLDLVDSVPNTKVSCTEPKPKTTSIQPSKSQPSLYSARRNSLIVEQKIKECTSDSQASASSKKPIVLPKIDINKRKHLFENPNNNNNNNNNEDDSKLRKSVSSGNIATTKSIKDRLSMFGKTEEPVNPKIDKQFLPKVSVKERLSSIERQNSVEVPFNSNSVEDFKSSQIIKQSLSNSKSESNKHSESPNTKPKPIMNNEELNKTQRKEQEEDRMNEKTNSASHCNNYVEQEQIISNPNPNPDPEPETQRDNIYNTDSSEKCLSSDDEYRNSCNKHFRHRSLDSLNSDSKFESSPFARVQSFEELDFRDRGSCLSGDTDREDSGIHTADVSSCVSQSDECDTMSMGDMDMHHLEATNLSVIPEVLAEQTVTTSNSNACQYDTMPDLQNSNSPATANELKEDLVNANIVLNHAENFPDQSNSNCDSYYQLESRPITEEVITPTEKPMEVSGPNVNMGDFTETFVPIQEEPKQVITEVIQSRQSPEKTTLFTSDLIVPNLDFPLDLNYCDVTKEPPSEPPPPPPGLSDDSEEEVVHCETPLKRNDSTKRLKREIHLKRSSFLGIDGSNAEDYLEAELRVKTPVDVVGLLQNELQYRYNTDYQFAYDKIRTNNNNEEFGFDKIQTNDEKYYYGNLEDKNNSYFHRQSVCSGDSGVASPSSTPQPQLEQEFNFSQQDHFHQNNLQRVNNDLKNFNQTSPKQQNYNAKNNSYNNVTNSTKNQEPVVTKEESYKDSSYQQTTQYYNEQNNRGQNLVDRNIYANETERNLYNNNKEVERNIYNNEAERNLYNNETERNLYNNYNGDHKTTNINHTQNEYYSKQNIQYNDQTNRSKHDNNELYNDKCVTSVPEPHVDRQLYSQYKNQLEYTNNNHEDLYKQDYYNNSRDVYQNAEVYLQPEYANQEYMQEKYQQEKYPLYNNYTTETEKNLHYKNDGNEYYQNYNHLECPNVMRRSLQDITHKSIALYENTSAFQDDYRTREMARQQKAIPAGGRSMPNLKDIKYRAALSQQTNNTKTRPPQPDPYANHSSSRIPKPAAHNENGAQVKRKPKQQGCMYNYNQHWLIQEAEHRRIIEQQQRKSLPSQQTTTVKPEISSKPLSANSSRSSIPQSTKTNGTNGKEKGLPDAIIENLTRRVQHKLATPVRRPDEYESKVQLPVQGIPATNLQPIPNSNNFQYYNRDKMLSVSGKNKCSFCSEELGRGAAMIIESLHLFYHIHCFKCSVCCIQLGDGLMGTDVRVRNNKLHCQNCYSNDDGVKFSCV